MKILSTKGWDDYELLDSGNSHRLERFGKYIISRPDPQAIWKPLLLNDSWNNADAKFLNNKWVKKTNFQEKWILGYKNVKFFAKLTPFKHTGIFPEQSLHWDFIEDALSVRKGAKILNLFGYTGISSLIALKNNAKVTHVDASKPAMDWFKENLTVSNLLDKPVRFILDDAASFVKREIKRNNLYDGVLLDPPVYGHGPGGERWSFNANFPALLNLCKNVLSKNPLFVIANAYAISSSSIMLENLFKDEFSGLSGNIDCGELALEEKSGRFLSTGIFATWKKQN